MRLHRICGVRFRSHLRSYARAYAYRGLTAFASLSMAVSGRLANCFRIRLGMWTARGALAARSSS
ncbi:MAG: hypothetical protein ABW087_20605 [Candidatus Thiodiazotropha sp.]